MTPASTEPARAEIGPGSRASNSPQKRTPAAISAQSSSGGMYGSWYRSAGITPA